MSARLRHLVDEYRQRLDRHQELSKKTRKVVQQWNSSLQMRQRLKLAINPSPQKRKLFITERSIVEPTTHISLTELSKVLETPRKSESVLPAGVSRFLSLKSISRSSQALPKINAEHLKHTRSTELTRGPQAGVARNQQQSPAASHLKFKLISKSFHSVEDLFRIRKPSNPKLLSNRSIVPELSYHPKLQELQALVQYHFQKQSRVICFIKKQSVSWKVQFSHFRMPFDMSEPEMRQEWRRLHQRLVSCFFFNPQKKCFLYDCNGNPIDGLLGICRESSVVLLSHLPKLEFSIDQKAKALIDEKNSLLNELYLKAGVVLHEYLTDNYMRMKERVDYVEQYCQNPAEPEYANKPLLAEYEHIDRMYNRKESQTGPPPTPSNRLNVFLRVSPKKKDFNVPQLQLVQQRRNALLKQSHDSMRRKAYSQQKLISRLPQQADHQRSRLNHRDLIRKMAVEPSCHDFLIKTKFNREEVVKLKSLYDSTVALALRMDNRAGERGVPKGLLLEALAGFGFDTSPNLLSQLLNHKPFINWDNFLRLMESLIHKNSSESLDEYLDTLPTKDRLSYEQVVQIIRFGLEKLIIFKDSFYDGYQLLFARNLFQEMGLPLEQPMPVDSLRSFLGKQRKHKTFEYIFFQ